MLGSEKNELFKQEVALISDERIKEFTQEAIGLIPDYIFTIPASSTGKYHPAYALGEGGLLRHIKAAVRIAYALFGNETVTGKFSSWQKDIIISALILHDGTKSGVTKTDYTVANHASLMADYLRVKMKVHGDRYDSLVEEISPLIASHMGQWNTDRDGAVVSPRPETAMERFVHMVDYLASRKFIEINFNAF
jgi:hypothetical protein